MPTGSLRPYLPQLAVGWQERVGDKSWTQIDGSMVFVDVSGFTSMSERLARRGRIGAEEVTEVIGDTFGRLLAEAYSLGGHLLKFGGDALLLFFQGDDHPIRAAAAAQGMRAELRRSGTFTTAAGRVTLRMSVGAHSGGFHFFLVGDSHRELMVAGPAASATVAMESAATAGQILVSPQMAEALPRRHRGRSVGPGVLLTGDLSSVEHSAIASMEAFDEMTAVRLVPTALREALAGGGPESAHRPVTVAFVQFLGMDGLLDEVGPEEASREVEALVVDIQRAVDAQGLCFLSSDVAGDGGKVILAAGAPHSTGNDEERMMLAAREIVAGERRLPVRIGVNRGYVFAGDVGPFFRRTYTVMGDTVNLAARLMAKAQPGQVLATASVLEGSRTLFATSELEPFLVKGKKKPVQAYSVGEAQGSRTSIAEVGLPLIGRDDELRSLIEAWQAARRGSRRTVELIAEPGIGKTRLLEEFLRSEEQARVVASDCRLYQATTPYFSMQSLLRRLLGFEGLGPDDTADALRALVQSAAPDLEPWLSLLGVPFDIRLPESQEVRQIDEEFRRSRMHEAVAALLVAAITDPVILVVDDTHWMDEASAALLAHLLASSSGPPGLLIASRRPGSDGFTVPDETQGLDRIELRVLDSDQAETLIDAAAPDRPLRPEQVRDLAARAEGNPLFLIELLDALRRGEDVEVLPRSVEGLIGARIDRLPGDDRTLLRHLSVLGSGFLAEHIPSVQPSASEGDVRPALRRLAEFLSVDRRGWVQFRHALMRDAAYGGLPYRTRQRLHARVGDSILDQAGEHPETQAELLSLHFFHAHRWSEAWRFSRVAADHARDAYANSEAVHLYRRAVTAGRRSGEVATAEQVRMLAELAEVAEQAGLYDESLGALREATRMSGDDHLTRADLSLRKARAHLRMGSYGRALRETAQGLRLTEGDGGGRVRSRILALRGSIRVQQGRPTEALNCARAAVDLAEPADELEALAQSYQVLDGALEMLGRHEEVVHADAALAIYERLGDLQGIAHVANDKGVQAYFLGRWDECTEEFARARDLFLKAGNETQAAMAAANLGEVLVGQRRLAEAEPVLVEAVRILRTHGELDLAINAEAQLARLRVKAGDLDEGTALLARLYEEAIEAGQWSSALQVAVYLVQGLVAQTRPEDAIEVLERAQSEAAEDLEVFAASLARARAEVLLALGRRGEAVAEIEAGLGSARDQGLLYDESQLLLLEAEAKSDPTRLEQAQGLLQQLGVRVDASV